MAVFQLVRRGTRRECEKLIAKTNTEYRFFISHCFFDVFNSLRAPRRITGSVRYEEAVVLFFGEIVVPRNPNDSSSSSDEGAHDIFFHAAIDSDDARTPFACPSKLCCVRP